MAGQVESGDSYLVEEYNAGVLAAAIDGLGHGPAAAAAAKVATDTLSQNLSQPMISIVETCHKNLMGSPRGVAMSLASFGAADGTLTWLGVGNVQGLLIRVDDEVKPHRESLLMRGGVVGYNLPPLRVSQLRLTPGDRVVLASDGVSANFKDGSYLPGNPKSLANHILSVYNRKLDDALVLVVKYLGRANESSSG
jgi:serine phosphatase RsbU (regulator of sigma subunit)